MKYLDIVVQTALFILALVLLIISFGEHDWPMALLLVQLLIGPWQFLGAIVSVAVKAELSIPKRNYLFVSSGYLLLLAASAYFKILPSGRVFTFFVMAPAWVLAIVYYTITWKWVLSRNSRRGSFLPNTRF